MENLEYNLIKYIITSKNNYSYTSKYINKLNLEKEIKNIINTIILYYNKYNNKESINIEELKTFFFLNNSLLKHKDKEVYYSIFQKIEELTTSEELLKDIVVKLLERQAVQDVLELCVSVLDGSSPKDGLLSEIKSLVDQAADELHASGESEASTFVDADLDELLELDSGVNGLEWHLKCLQTDFGSLHGPVLGHVFARPDSAKSTFCLSAAAHFARQLKGEDECVLYCINEDPGTRIKLRLYSAVTGMTALECKADVAKAKQLFAANGGHRILLFDSAVISINALEELVKKHKPRVTIIDQGWKVVFPGRGELAEHAQVANVYNKFRELCKRYNMPIISVGQADADAEGRKWLTLTNMDGNKTRMPGELDFAIGIGKTHTEEEQNVRYLSVVKNKLGQGAHNRHTVLVDTSKCRYYD